MVCLTSFVCVDFELGPLSSFSRLCQPTVTCSLTMSGGAYVDIRGALASRRSRLGLTLPTEVYYLIAQFLREGPCVRAAQTLLDDIAAHPDLAMVRHDWEGRVHPLAFSEAVSCFLYLDTS